MIQKQLRLVVTFHTTAGAMAMERLCRKEHIEGRLLPVPRCITSDCGIAWCAHPETRSAIEAAVAGRDMDVAGYFEVLV
jgi:hypothetical protein